MKTIRILFSVLFLLGMTANAFSDSETFSSPWWKKGNITRVTGKYIEIDGTLRRTSNPIVIKTLYGDELDSNLELLRGVEKIYFKEKSGEIIEIRIFSTAQ